MRIYASATLLVYEKNFISSPPVIYTRPSRSQSLKRVVHSTLTITLRPGLKYFSTQSTYCSAFFFILFIPFIFPSMRINSSQGKYLVHSLWYELVDALDAYPPYKILIPIII